VEVLRGTIPDTPRRWKTDPDIC